jgi:hypothetical protein
MEIVKPVVWMAVLFFPFFVAGVALYIHLSYNPPYRDSNPSSLASLIFDSLFSPIIIAVVLRYYPYTAIPFVVYYVLVAKCSSRINRLIISIGRRL